MGPNVTIHGDAKRGKVVNKEMTSDVGELKVIKARKEGKRQKRHTTPGIRWSSPTQLLVWPSLAYLWESGRDPEFSSGYGRMCLFFSERALMNNAHCGSLRWTLVSRILGIVWVWVGDW